MDTSGESSKRAAAVGRRAVSWLASCRSRFDPDNADPASAPFVRKALVEMALLVGLRARMDPDAFDADHELLIDQVASVAGRASYRELVVRDERALLLYAGTYAALRLCGRDDAEFRHLVEQSATGRYAACFERVPYRQLDLLHTLEVSGIDHAMPGIAGVLPFSLLCADPSVLKLRDPDIYAITHTVFYATDFGVRIPPWPDGFRAADAVHLLEALSVLCRQQGNADLVAELLCSLLCLGVHDSPEVERAWAFLADLQEGDGRLAGPEGVVHPDFEGSDEAYRAWATGYHTTIVAALAGLLACSPKTIRQPRPAPAPAAGDPRRRAALRRAAAHLADTTADAPLQEALPAVAAALRGTRAADEPQLAHRALAAVLRRVEAGPGPAAWRRFGADVAFECARGAAASGLKCHSLDRFLSDTGAALTDLTAIPASAAGGVRQLKEAGRLDAAHADLLLASTTCAELAAHDAQPVALAQSLIQYTNGDPALLGADDSFWRPVAERFAAALPAAYEDYRIEHLAILLHGLALLGWADHRITRDGLDFLLSQQQPSGAFGHPAHDDPPTRAAAQRIWTQNCVLALSALA